MTTLRIGGYQVAASIMTRAVTQLAALLCAVPGLRWQVELVPDVTQSDVRAADLLTMVEQGTFHICYFASSYLAARVAALRRFDVPFSVVDRDHLYADLDGEVGARMAGELARLTGYRLLGFWDNGFRHVSNRMRPIRHPRDCRGLRIRTLDNAVYQQALAAVGFTPVVIDVKDLAAAVETLAVDAQENPLTNTLNFGLHRFHRHISLTSHFHGVALLLVNGTWLDGLSPDRRSVLLAAATEATRVQRRLAIEEDDRCLARLRHEGVAVVAAEDIELAAFRAAVVGIGT
jgi:TRAP-type transport system periplasmic protein